MKYTKIPDSTFQNIQLNAGVLLSSFTPSTPSVDPEDIIGATSGGFAFADTPTFTDFGEDIDNCPRNMMELKKLDAHEVTASGTFVTVSPALAKMLIGTADTGTPDQTKVTPRNDVLLTDFTDLWWVGDYSEYNGETNGGFVAIHMMNVLSTGGFQLQSANRGKGQFAFSFTAHYSMEAQDTVPYEVYIKAGTAEAAG